MARPKRKVDAAPLVEKRELSELPGKRKAHTLLKEKVVASDKPTRRTVAIAAKPKHKRAKTDWAHNEFTAESAQKSRWTLFYVAAQFFILFGILASISRCSPLSPSQSITDIEAQTRGGTLGGSANGLVAASGVAGGASGGDAARTNLDADLERAQNTIRVEITFVAEAPTPDSIFRVELTPAERQRVRAGIVDLFLARRSRAAGLSQAEVTQKISRLRAVGTSRAGIVLRILVPESYQRELSELGWSQGNAYALRGRLAADEQEGKARILPLSELEDREARLVQRAITIAQSAHLDILGNR